MTLPAPVNLPMARAALHLIQTLAGNLLARGMPLEQMEAGLRELLVGWMCDREGSPSDRVAQATVWWEKHNLSPDAEGQASGLPSLMAAAAIDWPSVCPTALGHVFEALLSLQLSGMPMATSRRADGVHYTGEVYIRRVIEPLFLEDLQTRLRNAGQDPEALRALHAHLIGFTLFDPACGTGNFLAVAYRELRQVAQATLQAWQATGRPLAELSGRVSLAQCFGLELDARAVAWANQILGLIEARMDLADQALLGEPASRISGPATPTLICANALRVDWASVLPAARCTVLLGNPPFLGAKQMSAAQRADMAEVTRGLPQGGLLDYAAGWFLRAGAYLQGQPHAQAGLVTTNSLTQGEQPGILWSALFARGMHLRFAHRTFAWASPGRDTAAVHCVILGFGAQPSHNPRLYTYPHGSKVDPVEQPVSALNPYLLDAPPRVVVRRPSPGHGVPRMAIGNKPIDGGHYLFTPTERQIFLDQEPGAAPYFRRWMGAEEFLSGQERWCLFVPDMPAKVRLSLPWVQARVEQVRALRQASRSAPTRRLADTPDQFHVTFRPKGDYLVVPESSSGKRDYVPIGYLDANTLPSSLVRVVPHATLYHFGVLSSALHHAWLRTVGGRLKSDYRYSVQVVYNTFPWPDALPQTSQEAIVTAAQAVLDARQAHGPLSLSQLYAPGAMPQALLQAHAALDQAVENAYGYAGPRTDEARVAFLFQRLP